MNKREMRAYFMNEREMLSVGIIFVSGLPSICQKTVMRLFQSTVAISIH